ncbi:hypothetical protein [Clostridium beijerinckii]|uniref:hypothetical protein n=1 Tax=Clostridium beijerinckii TaxID=1520 RepID=UPI00156F7802|nr:hypothetical protein [Clostridium beijerinckii]NRT73276.1 hypothetical protein [Clostridium beijerinckii]
MRKKINRLVILIVIILLAMTNLAYAQPIPKQNIQYGPKISELKNKQDIIKNFQDIKTIRTNIATINIRENSTNEQLIAVNTSIKNYINEYQQVIRNLEEHKRTYSDSISDVFFSDQISFIAQSFVISLRHQQNLIRALQGTEEESKRLFYSSYLIPVYYYLTLGDQMIAYIDNYFTLPD